MRTLTLLAAILLLAFQAQAQTLQETADQLPAQDQPGDEDQDLLGDEDQDVAVSFTGEERTTRQLTGATPVHMLWGLHPLEGLLEAAWSLGSKMEYVCEEGEKNVPPNWEDVWDKAQDTSTCAITRTRENHDPA